jgi:hypothetical protein
MKLWIPLKPPIYPLSFEIFPLVSFNTRNYLDITDFQPLTIPKQTVEIFYKPLLIFYVPKELVGLQPMVTHHIQQYITLVRFDRISIPLKTVQKLFVTIL